MAAAARARAPVWTDVGLISTPQEEYGQECPFKAPPRRENGRGHGSEGVTSMRTDPSCAVRNKSPDLILSNDETDGIRRVVTGLECEIAKLTPMNGVWYEMADDLRELLADAGRAHSSWPATRDVREEATAGIMGYSEQLADGTRRPLITVRVSDTSAPDVFADLRPGQARRLAASLVAAAEEADRASAHAS